MRPKPLPALAAAAPSYFGYTGLIRVPTADALSSNEFNAGAFFIRRDELDDPNVYAGNLDIADGAEVGVSVIPRDSEMCLQQDRGSGPGRRD